jgi:hypothetical protein
VVAYAKFKQHRTAQEAHIAALHTMTTPVCQLPAHTPIHLPTDSTARTHTNTASACTPAHICTHPPTSMWNACCTHPRTQPHLSTCTPAHTPARPPPAQPPACGLQTRTCTHSHTRLPARQHRTALIHPPTHTCKWTTRKRAHHCTRLPAPTPLPGYLPAYAQADSAIAAMLHGKLLREDVCRPDHRRYSWPSSSSLHATKTKIRARAAETCACTTKRTSWKTAAAADIGQS